MKHLLRWIGIALVGLAGLGIIAYAVLYVLSERVLRHTYEVPTVSLSIPTDSTSISEGQRLATLRGCFAGCHGQQAEGKVMFERPDDRACRCTRILLPPPTNTAMRDLPPLSGTVVRPGGAQCAHNALGSICQDVTDADLVFIIAFPEALCRQSRCPVPDISAGPAWARRPREWQVQTGGSAYRRNRPAFRRHRTKRLPYGRYLARTICAQCHGTALRGDSNPDFSSPDLQVVAAYSLDASFNCYERGSRSADRTPWA